MKDKLYTRKYTISVEGETEKWFQGWDGKSYDGESRNASVYRTDIKSYEDVRFIKVGKHVHYIEENHMVVEKATGEAHPTASWLVDVLPARKET